MEFEQIGKRLEWLDEQQRKSKTDLSDLGERLTSIETSVNALTLQFKTANQGLSELTPAIGAYQSIRSNDDQTTHRLKQNDRNDGKGHHPARTGGHQAPSHGIGRAEKIDHADRQDR